MTDETPIARLPRTSAMTIKRMQNLGISTYGDLLHYYPARYEDFSIIAKLGSVQPGEMVTLKGTISSFSNGRTKRGFQIQKAKLTDETGKIDLIWYNQSYLSSVFKAGAYVAVAGTIELFGTGINMKPVEYEILNSPDADPIHTGRLVPVYPQTYGLSTRTIREKLFYILKSMEGTTQEDYLPEVIREQYSLVLEFEALKSIHYPKNQQLLERARERIGFDELYIKLLSSRIVRKLWEKEQVTHAFDLGKKIQTKIKTFTKKLPFELTKGQTKSIDEILADLGETKPMNRFLQGDVGSGKTVVSATAAYVAHLNGYQTLYMAPTEILAQQHFITLTKLLAPYGMKIALQTGAAKTFTKKSSTIKEYDIIVGTHALLTGFLDFAKVGLVVIDEQHRFGVKQRATLKQKGVNPHLLTMTATPIPRTVSLTLYSELDLSIIDEMPKGRLPIKTHVVQQEKRTRGYEWIKDQIKKHKTQVYIICPLIEVSKNETMQTVKAATKEFEFLRDSVFPPYKVALLHGRMKPKEKEQIMRDYKEKKYDVLVSTSVVEVGIDVPNATIMIIEGAERFGLAQLHQLRGRVGRGDKQSYCFLYTSTKEAQYSKRLYFFANTTSGMKLAEYDLKLRGPGDMYGTQQSGYDDLKIAQITDYPLIKKVKDAVDLSMEKDFAKKYPELQKRIDLYQVEQISRD